MKHDHYLVITPKSVVHIHLHVIHGWHILLHTRLQVPFILYAIGSTKYVHEYFHHLNDGVLLFWGVELFRQSCILRFLMGAILQRTNITNETKCSPEIAVSIL